MEGSRRPSRMRDLRRRRGTGAALGWLVGLCALAVLARLDTVGAKLNPDRKCCPEGDGNSVVPIGDVERTCCRATDCSLCSGVSLSPKQGGNDIPTALHLSFEAVPSGPFCPGGTAVGDHLCTQMCAAAGSSRDHSYALHRVVHATAPLEDSTCADCCVPDFDVVPVPCGRKCDPAAGAKCFACSASSHESLAGKPCGSYVDIASCAHPEGDGVCLGHACAVQTLRLQLDFVRAMSFTVDAPRGAHYVLRPTAAGLLVMHWSFRLEPHRETCCPPGQIECCGGGYQPGTFCNGPEECGTADGGQCRAFCGCPFDLATELAGPAPSVVSACPARAAARAARQSPTAGGQNAQGDVPCYTMAGQRATDVCEAFDARFALTSEHFDLLGASPSFGDAAPRTLSELQAADAALRPAAPGRAEVRLYGGGILVDLEVAIPVAAGREYSFQGVRVRPFTEESHRAANMCASRFVIPLKPTALVLRTHVLAAPASGPLPAEAAMQMATEPGCTRQADCPSCTAFVGAGGARCEWRHALNDCYAANSSLPETLPSARCASIGEPIAMTVDEGTARVGGAAALLTFAILLSLCAFGGWQYYESYADDYGINMHTMAQPAGGRAQWVADVRKARGREVRLVPRSAHLPPRTPAGAIDHAAAVALLRARDPDTPWHLMPEDEVARHAARFAYQRHGQE